MRQRRLEVRTIPHDAARHPSQTMRPQRFRDRVHRGPGGVAAAGRQGIDRVTPLRPGGIAAPVQNQVTLEHATRHGAVRIHAGPWTEIGGQQHRRGRGDDELRVAGRHRKPIAIAIEEHATVVVLGEDVPRSPVERRRVEQPVQPLLDRLPSHWRGGRRANRKRREDQLSHRARL